MELVVTIIGFGNIGKCIGSLLLNLKNLPKVINVLDPDPNIIGAFYDFEHATQLYPSVSIKLNDFDIFNDSDVIFHCAGPSVPKGESRLSIGEKSVQVTEQIFNNYKSTKSSKIIVVSNPVEIITFVTQRITNLQPQNVIGTGTMLDSLRMQSIIKNKYPEFAEIEPVILGEHGDSMFVSCSLSKLNGIQLNKSIGNDELEMLLREVKDAAKIIKQTQGATIYGVSHCAVYLYESIVYDKTIKVPASVEIPEYLTKDLILPPISLSLYCAINGQGAYPIKSALNDNNDIEFLQKSAHALYDCIPVSYK